MALTPNYVNIGVAGGLDKKTDRKLVHPPNTLVANNVRYVTAGSVRKRYGINVPPQPVTSTAIDAIGNTNDELLAADASYLYAYSPGGTAWANRGVCPQIALNTKTIGSYQLPLTGTNLNTQVRQLTYDVVGNLGLAAWDSGDNIDANGNVTLGSITLCLFDTVTGKSIWTTQISQTFTGASTSKPVAQLFSKGFTTMNNVSSSSAAYGCAYPVVRAFQGQFYLAYIGCFQNTFYTSGTSGSTINAYIYYVAFLRLADPSLIVNSLPALTYNSITNATGLAIPYGSFRQVSITATSSPYTAPLWFDMATNGYDLTLFINGQSYGTTPAVSPSTPFAAPGSVVLSVTAPTQNNAVVNSTILGVPNNTAQIVTLAPTPQTVGSSSVSSDAAYVAAFATGLFSFSAPSLNSGTITQQNNVVYYGINMSAAQPMSANITGIPGSGAYDLQVTDGVFYNRFSMTTSPLNLSLTSSAQVIVDYGADPAGLLPIAGTRQAPVLQSRIFTAPDGQPVAWILLAGFNVASFNCLALVNIGSSVTPPSIYAHAFYLRTGAQLPSRQASNVVNGSFLAFQVTDIPNQVAAIKRLSIMNTPAPQIVKLNQGALITGGDTKYYDGKSVRTMGWLKFPEIYTGLPLSDTVTGGSLIPGFAYSYVVVWVDYDAYGNAIYSSPSPVAYLDGSTASAPTGLVAGCNTTVFGFLGQFNEYMVPSRGQYILYRNCKKDPLTYRRIQNPSQYQPGSRSLTYLYDLSPEDNTANPLLYSQPSGGELPNDPPPSSNYAVTTIKRPFVASAENPSWLYFGKPYFPGRPPEFNADQFLDIDPPSGDITGLAVLDQNVIIFKKERIFVLAGDGPDATGAGTFNNTYAVATDTGCIDSRSIVSTESGVYFRSIRGIQLLDRSLSVTYIGAAVENVLGTSTIASAVLVPGQNQIRFALISNDPAIQGTAVDNVVLVYDYFLQKWSTYGFNPNNSAGYNLQLIGQATWRNNWFGLSNNLIYQDASPNTTSGLIQFTDNSTPITMTLETGWIPLAGPQGFGRLRRVSVLGDFESAHTLTLNICYDYSDTIAYSIPYVPANTVAGTPQEWRIRAPRQVGQSVKFQLVDSSTAGESCVITGLLLETSQKSGAPRLPDAQSV